MHTDARTLERGSLLEGDLCIVGAGAAGISMALEWENLHHRVILLEGGGFTIDADVQDRYRGEIVGEPYVALQAARLHFFGGTTGHWAGFSSIFDPIDFAEREWVPYSGWPIARDDLDPFYVRAHRYLELGPFEFDDVGYWEAQFPGLSRLPLDGRVVWTKMWQFSPPTRFGTRYREEIVESANVHLVTNANVCDVEANEPVTAVTGLLAKTPEGKEIRVRARYYVLACGAIQNARILLASNRQAPAGLGNGNDLVGRFFMEHLHMPGSIIAMARPGSSTIYSAGFGSGQRRSRGELALTGEVQRTYGILNGTASFRGVGTGPVRSLFRNFSEDAVGRVRAREERERAAASQPVPTHATPIVPPEAPDPEPAEEFTLFSRQEQAPNPDSRVMLSEERDALGVPRVKLDWRLTELDKRSLRVYHEVVAREVGRSGVGRVRLLEWLMEDDWPSFLSGGWHHMGTLRMADDPRNGVVDADCKVHGVENLFVAGSAAFPTGGAVNPTLTLVALSLRVSDHLKARLR